MTNQCSTQEWSDEDGINYAKELHIDNSPYSFNRTYGDDEIGECYNTIYILG